MDIVRIFLLKFCLLFSILCALSMAVPNCPKKIIYISGGVNTLRFASYYHSHMVLQMSPKRAQIWGYAETVGDFIHVKLNGTEVGKVIVKQRDDGTGGIWSALLPRQHAGGPVTISIGSSEGQAAITDVLFGDVWVCSGQSNMRFGLRSVLNHTDEVQHASYFHNIRFLNILRNNSSVPLSEPVIGTQWQSPKLDGPTRSFSAVCLLYAMELAPHINRPIGLVESAWGGTPIEPWSSPDAIASCAQQVKRSPRQENVIWNAMIHPILKMTIYGAIWYQGEDNKKNPEEYACRFPAMIDDWRSKFHSASQNQTNKKFPFGFVQLAPADNVNAVKNYGFPDVRWAQTAEYGYVPNPRQRNVFMAVTMDLPDFNSTLGATGHPRDKQDVAQRLALAGRAVAYGNSNIDFQGPVPSAFTLVGHKLTIEFDHGNSAIEIRTNNGFEVCCRAEQHDKCSAETWTPAPISSHDLKSVTMDTSGCNGNQNVVTAVRYAWLGSPCEFKKCAIYDRNNDLPASPFVKIGPFASH